MTAVRPGKEQPEWLRRVHARLRRWCAHLVGSRWVIAVSGGGDSVGLLRLLHAASDELGLVLSVAHLDHGVRGDAAAADAAFVAGLAESLGLPFDLGHWRPRRAGHFEADARRARYAWLTQVAAARGASAVAVGHTRDDQAETILHRIVRGTGLRGLSGMRARRPLGDSVQLVRPLLGVSRQEIRDYLAGLGQPFRDDAMNADLTHARARIRHDLLPRLETEFNPRVAQALVRLGRLAEHSQRVVEEQVAAVLEAARIPASEAKGIVLLREPLQATPLILRAEVIREAWRRAGWPEGRMRARDWLRAAGSTQRAPGRFSLPGGVQVRVSAGCLSFSIREPSAEVSPRPPVCLTVPGSVVWGQGRITAALGHGEVGGDFEETIDLDCLAPFVSARQELCLEVRAPGAGDRFEPLGMNGRGMSLNDFFRGRRIGPEDRRDVPLVHDAAGIIWVAGQRIAHRVRQTERTTRTLSLKWEKPPGGMMPERA